MVINTYGLQKSANYSAEGSTLREIARCLSVAPPNLGRLLGTRKQHQKSGGSTLARLLERGCIQASKELSLVSLPSWVPDFTSTLLEPSCETKRAALFSASGQSSLYIVPEIAEIDSRVIGLRGARVNTIMAHGSLFTVDNRQGIVSRSTGEFLKIHANTTRYFDEIAHFCEQGQAINAKSTKPISQHDIRWFGAHWRIPCADQTVNTTFRTRVTDVSLIGYNNHRRSIELYSDNARSITDQHLTEEEFEANTAEYLRCIQTTAYVSYKNAMAYQQNRRPFISTQGYVGLTPGHSVPGDVIIIIFGTVQPFVVRSGRG
ncbi:hypothetical protein sscle_02g021020 [Sclerotinia sclerotiorum 1980 UF-70]|uniref:Uncharacterized protein n=1 Tax=Sclerotinia sclerotiorum (strain ATCC 18683 / 1980 / Ss-1) TaxID=665079 RepID=A0A1D9PXQ1_SCLS1|nr:hypothetical protein sscle_02g021020 [Sclerotinia sclerotiorum 1980 UF-70]